MSPLPRGIARAFRLALRRPRIAEDVDDEVAFHLEMRVAELVATGWSEEDARAEALRRFGNTQQWSMAMRAVDQDRIAREQRGEWLDNLRQDARFAVRSFARAPMFTALAVLTLALGIGANTAVFSVLKSVLLDALPYADADALLRVYGRRVDGSSERAPLSATAITMMRDGGRAFASIGAFVSQPREVVLTTEAGPNLLRAGFVEPQLFRTLGVVPARGRLLQDEDAAADTVFNVVLSHAAWQRLFGGDSAVLGKPVMLNNIPRRVVGVLPQRFVGPAGDVEFYMPFSLRGALKNPVMARLRQNYGVIARLNAGATVEAADREAAAVAATLAREYPAELGSSGANAVTVRQSMSGDTRTPLLVLMASAALVLLITCANLAGALLSRTISRRKEFALRSALGAGRGRLVRQLLTESMLLAAAGGICGMLLALGGLRLMRGLAGTILPSYASLSLDPVALVVTGALALFTGLAFGLLPALSVGRSDLQGALREEARGASESRRSRQMRGVLVSGQIALSISLLAGAALLARSLFAMTGSPLGFSSDGVLTARVFLPPARYASGAAREGFMRQFEDRLRSVPGITRVASANDVPTRMTSRNGFFVEGAPPLPADARPLAVYADVSDDYFATLNIPLKAGRFFNATERMGGPLSLIVTEGMVKRYWPTGDAIGSRVRLGAGTDEPVFTVVGVVGDVRNDPSRPEPDPFLYLSNRQMPWNGPVFLLRTTGDPRAMTASIRQALTEFDATVPMYDIAALEDVLSDGFAGRRLPVVLMTAFGALALLLASVGVYAMFAAMASAREREFAVRVALGSSRRAIAGLVLRQGAGWMTAGLAVGALGVYAITRAVRTLLYGVGPFDPVALGIATLLLVGCAALALLAPVRRATRADPNSILR